MENDKSLEEQIKEINDTFDELDNLTKVYTEKLNKIDINDIQGE